MVTAAQGEAVTARMPSPLSAGGSGSVPMRPLAR